MRWIALAVLVLAVAAPGRAGGKGETMRWYRGDIHTHDINRPPLPELIERYRSAGYDFAIMETKDEDEACDVERFCGDDFLGITGVEQGFLLRRAGPGEPKDLYGHLNAFPQAHPLRDMDEVWVPAGVELLRRVAPDAVLQLNHPTDGRWRPADLQQIYDAGISMIELNDESHNPKEYAVGLWDQALTAGYRLWCQLSSDLHGGGRVTQCGHIMVRAPRLGRQEILAAMRAGDFYAVEEGCTAAVREYGLRRAGRGWELAVRAPGGAQITVIGPGGKPVAQLDGDTAAYRPQGESYLRVEVADAAGKRLFLQPVWPADRAAMPASDLVLPGKPLSLHLDPKSGAVNGVMLGERNLLRSPGGLRLKFAGKAAWHTPGAGRGRLVGKSAELQHEHARGQFAVKQQIRPTPTGWDWTVEVTDRSGADREMELALALPVVGPGWRTWLPNGADPQPYSPQGFALQYRRCHDGSPGVPVIGGYNPQLGAGLALAVSPDTPQPSLELVSQPPGRTLGLRAWHVLLPAGGTVRCQVHIFTYRGSDQAAYDCYRRRHPALFRPVSPAIQAARGAWWCASPQVTTEGLDGGQRLGIVFYQIHCHYPQMGEYWTPAETWTTNVRQEGGREKTRAIIRAAHARGMKTFLYTCSCECAYKLAEAKFPTSIVRDEKGEPVRGWWYEDYEGEHCYLMNPDPAYPYGRALIKQIEQLIDTYPETDGIFIDRTDYDRLDFGHQDGRTMVGGRRASQQAFGIERYLARAAQTIHGRGKLLMMNVPFYIEAARYADAVCADMHIQRLPIFRYMAGDKPAFYIHTNGPTVAERLDAGLRWGVYPDYVEPTAENVAAYQAALPLIDLVARAALPAGPARAASSQPGLRAQLFQAAEGWLVSLVGACREPVRITLQGVGRPTKAGLVTPAGRTPCEVRDWGGEMVVDLPAMSGPAVLEVK